jgi:hypothetical protein
VSSLAGRLARALALGVLGIVLVLHATAPSGPSVSPDSAVYLSVADALVDGRGFVQFDDQPMTRWAPLYPALVAGVARAATGGVTHRSARAVDAVGFGLVLALSAAWLERHVRRAWIRLPAALVIAIAPVLLQCAVFVWSEMTYLTLALVCLRAAEALLGDTPRRGTWLLVLGASAGLAAATRYAGLALVPVGIVAIALRAPRERRRGEIAAFLALALAPLALWVVRNALLTGHPLGEAWAARASLSRNAAVLVHIVSLWFFSNGASLVLRLLFVGAALSAWAIAVARLVRAGTLARESERAAFLPHALFVGSSVVVLLAWASVSGIETISDRYAAPLLPSVVLAAAWTVDRLLRERAGAGLAFALGLVFAVLAAHSAERTAWLIRLYRGPGEWGYRTQGWEASGTMRAAARLVPKGALVYSNAPDAIYARLGRPARLLPVRAPLVPEARGARELAHAHRAIAHAGGAWIVEFEAVQRSILVSADSLARGCTLDSVEQTDDGAILRVTCPPPLPPAVAPPR